MSEFDEIKPIQERTSTYFNSIVRRNVRPLNIDQLSQDAVDNFNLQIQLAFTDSAEETIRRVRYLIPYILQSIDWEEYSIPLEAWQLRYYYQRERFLAKSKLKYQDFLNHEPLQNSIAELDLSPEPTFEFILFLKYYFDMRSELRFSPIEQLTRARDALESLKENNTASIDINVGGKHYKIENTNFVKRIIASIPLEDLCSGAFINDFDQGSPRNKIRALDYFIIKTLLDYLPIKQDVPKRGTYSQAERNFGLSVLNYIGRLPSFDINGVCSRENNATFDKLMRDFNDEEIPFAMELFL